MVPIPLQASSSGAPQIAHQVQMQLTLHLPQQPRMAVLHYPPSASALQVRFATFTVRSLSSAHKRL